MINYNKDIQKDESWLGSLKIKSDQKVFLLRRVTCSKNRLLNRTLISSRISPLTLEEEVKLVINFYFLSLIMNCSIWLRVGFKFVLPGTNLQLIFLNWRVKIDEKSTLLIDLMFSLPSSSIFKITFSSLHSSIKVLGNGLFLYFLVDDEGVDKGYNWDK